MRVVEGFEDSQILLPSYFDKLVSTLTDTNFKSHTTLTTERDRE